MPTVCVLIPTKNRRLLLERALKSLFDQVIPPDEIIIVNDGSSDETSDFLKNISLRHSSIRVFNRDVSGGVNVARHLGISKAKSDWIAFLDDDDEFFPDAIKKIKSRLAETPSSIDLAYFNSIVDDGFIRKDGGFQFNNNEQFHDPSYYETMIKYKLVGDCKPVYRRSLFENSKYRFPESVNGYESFLTYLLARDGRGIRYFRDKSTLVHFDRSAKHISISAPAKKPWPLFVLHFLQLFQHKNFYFKHLVILFRKIFEMTKLLLRSLIRLF